MAQKGTDTSLIERFMYPKFGPGQLWEHVAEKVVAMGGEIAMGWKVVGMRGWRATRVVAIEAVNAAGETRRFEGDYFLSTMPMRELVRAMKVEVPANVREVSEGLQYRDFITVGVLANKLKVTESDKTLIRTRGFISRSRMCCWDGYRSSITGVRTWWLIRRRYGLGLSISATRRDRCGRCRMRS